jgi:hypothetical protein
MRKRQVEAGQIEVGDVIFNNGSEHIVCDIIPVSITQFMLALTPESEIISEENIVYYTRVEQSDMVNLVLDRSYDVETRYEFKERG